MADVRINALSTTATSAASDDYLALDGSANGTRKILATNVAQNVTDVTFGTSGPSAKSSIAARAARQGLVCNGSNAANTVTLPAFGTASFTAAFWFRLDAAQVHTICDANNGLLIDIAADNSFRVFNRSSGAAVYQSSAGALTTGKNYCLVYARGSVYLDGIALQTGISDTTSYSASISSIGTNYAGNYPLNGFVYPLIYNRALSAAEVVSLYEAGVPSGADYNSASNTSIITGANSDFSSDTGYWTKVGTATISGGVATIPNNTSNITRNGLFTVGKRYRIQLTISSVSGGGLYVYDGAIQATYTTNGTKTLEWTATGANLIIGASGSGNVDDVLLYPLGLLLAPDAAQVGGGLTWYDTSGNAANITLPASGVSWNVPTSGNVTSGGALNLRAGGTNQNITFTPSGTGVHFFNGFNATAGTPGTYTVRLGNGSSDYVGLSFDGTYGYLQTWGGRPLYLNSQGNNIVTGGGNVLLGTTTDGGQKLQVAGTAAITGAVSIGNTVTTGVSVASTHKVQISIGGTTYYLLASNV